MRLLFFCAFVGSFAIRAFGANAACSTKTCEVWVACQLGQATQPGLAARAAQENQQNPTKQTDSPAISASSTSLVDHTSLADFVTGAVNVAGFGGGSGQALSGTTTVSAYAVYSGLAGHDPLDPAFYDIHSGLRQFTFSVGTGSPVVGSGAAAAVSGGSSKVVGAAFLIINHRDLSTKNNRKEIHKATEAAEEVTQSVLQCEAEIKSFLVATFGNAIYADPPVAPNTLNTQKIASFHDNDPAAKARIDAILNKYAPLYLAEADSIKKIVQKIQNAAQLSVSGQASIGNDQTQNSDYRAQMAFEKGMPGHFNLTANGSFDYVNSRLIGADTRGGRAAVDLQYTFVKTAKSASKKPVSLDFSGEGDWFQSFNPSYVGQVRLTIPLVAGVDFPVSFSYASNANLLHEAHAVGKFGLTFDLSRITAALTKQ
jgi:hypothetical protein